MRTSERTSFICKTKKLVIFGMGDLAEIAYEYFSVDSEYDVIGFTADRERCKEKTFCGLPVVPFDEVESVFPPRQHEMYCALVYKKMNRCRADACERAEAKDYALASYISSRAFVSPSAVIGKHCFIFEDNTIQPFVNIGNNVIMWSGNHCGHHSVISNNVFLSSHVVVSGHCYIGSNSFIGVNATLYNNTTIGAYSWVSPDSTVNGEVPPCSMVRSPISTVVPLNEEALNRALDRASEKANG
jgi:sugar O-acyltransferase (sialic acid O-acetyltransferase NeuD family)